MAETFLCSCGAAAKASGYPPAQAEAIIAELRRIHVEDEGHHEVEPKEHKRIRERQRRDEIKGLYG
jgi:hypothetical protein